MKLDPLMMSLNDLNDVDRIFSNKDIKQTQMYTHIQLADAKKSVTVLDLADQVKWTEHYIRAVVCCSYNFYKTFDLWEK